MLVIVIAVFFVTAVKQVGSECHVISVPVCSTLTAASLSMHMSFRSISPVDSSAI